MSGLGKKPLRDAEAGQVKRPPVDVEAALRDMSPARRVLFDQHLPLVEAVARYEVPRLKHRVPEDDLLQEGRIGLAKACATFDPEIAREKGRSFEQWAKPLIRWQMRKAVRTVVRREKRELRAAQEEEALHAAYGRAGGAPVPRRRRQRERAAGGGGERGGRRCGGVPGRVGAAGAGRRGGAATAGTPRGCSRRWRRSGRSGRRWSRSGSGCSRGNTTTR